MMPIKYLILEGPDCCGKTSLYNSIHKETKFKYNIHDRSFLSMLCYARLYGRDDTEYRRQLTAELCDANNVLVVLLPPLEVILQRYRSRGDDMQSEETLKKLYAIFDEEIAMIRSLQNVFVLKVELPLKDLTSYVKTMVSYYESASPEVIGVATRYWAQLGGADEVQLNVTLNVPVDYSDNVVMNDPREGEYYLSILKKCEEKIQDELVGKNPYGVPQPLDSRRFYYSSDTCISSIHFMLRGSLLKVICSLRSTDAERNGAIDLRFLTHLSAEVPRTFGWSVDQILLDVSYNSLHIRNDI